MPAFEERGRNNGTPPEWYTPDYFAQIYQCAQRLLHGAGAQTYHIEPPASVDAPFTAWIGSYDELVLVCFTFAGDGRVSEFLLSPESAPWHVRTSPAGPLARNISRIERTPDTAITLERLLFATEREGTLQQ